jgi:hypothetical protein
MSISQAHDHRRWSRRGILLVLALAVFLTGFLTGRTSTANTPAPGSDADPLVSRSYVDQLLALVVVELSPGQRIEAAGGTEIILRSGQARAISSAAGGVCDLTGGKDMAQNERITANHLLLVPRTDGRGLVAETKVFVMVRGPYIIK